MDGLGVVENEKMHDLPTRARIDPTNPGLPTGTHQKVLANTRLHANLGHDFEIPLSRQNLT
jgi:hypothetical protein